MALQDLTPQLRTRLSRMERAVGWFVFLATALLLFGFGYYLKHTAERRGWFKIKAPFFTYVQSSSGLNVGDPVVMMGFPVGQITLIKAMPPRDPHNVKIEFEIQDDAFRYLWTGGSYVKVNAADFLGKRQLEVTRGTNGYALVVTQPVSIHTLDEAKNLMATAPGDWQLAQDIFDINTNLLFHAYDHLEQVFNETNAPLLATANLESNSIYIYNDTVNRNHVVASWNGRYHHYKIFKPGDDTAWLRAVETPPVSDQLQAMVNQAQTALPNFLALTNQLQALLQNGANAASNVSALVVSAQPMVTNVNSLITHLDTNANSLIQNLDTNVAATLVNLANITSNLDLQVQSNTNILGWMSKTIVDSDTFVQGLKHHWLLRSAFKKENDAEAKAMEEQAVKEKAAKTNSPTPSSKIKP